MNEAKDEGSGGGERASRVPNSRNREASMAWRGVEGTEGGKVSAGASKLVAVEGSDGEGNEPKYGLGGGDPYRRAAVAALEC